MHLELKDYLKFIRPYERVIRQLLLDFEFFSEDAAGINIYAVHHRLKSFESAREKASRLNIPITELHDIAGLRIVVSTAKEVDVVVRFVYRKADAKDLVVESDRRIEKPDGYRARHLVLKVRGSYSRSVHETVVEIQLQTLMEHAYNYISRAWVYKSDRALSEEWREEFLHVSRALAELDGKITSLQAEVLESAILGKDEEWLTAFSFQRIVKDIFDESISIDDAVDAVQFLVDLGCNTNGLLRRFFADKRTLRVRDRFVGMLNTTGRKAAEIMINMPIHQFYLLYGVRIDAAEEFITKLESSFEKLPDLANRSE